MIYIFKCGCEINVTHISKIKRGKPSTHKHSGAICIKHQERLAFKIIACERCKKNAKVHYRYGRKLCDNCFKIKFPWRFKQRNKEKRNKEKKPECSAKNCKRPIGKGLKYLCTRCYQNNTESEVNKCLM